MLFKCLTGAVPYERDSEEAVMKQLRKADLYFFDATTHPLGDEKLRVSA